MISFVWLLEHKVSFINNHNVFAITNLVASMAVFTNTCQGN